MSGISGGVDMSAFIAKLAAGAIVAPMAAAEAQRDDIWRLMSEPKSGRMYYGWHQAAAPGEAPGIVMGNLLESIQVEQDGNSAIVGSTSQIGLYQEFGTARMPAHPFMAPSTPVGVAAGIAAAREALG